MLLRLLPWLITGLVTAAHVGTAAVGAGISAISSIARGMLGKKATEAEGKSTPTPGVPPTKETKEEAPFRPMDWILGKGPTGGSIDPAKITPLATAAGGDMDAEAILTALMGLDARATSIATVVAAQSNFLARIESLTRGVSGSARIEEATEGRLKDKKTAKAKQSLGFWAGLRKTAKKSLLPLAGLYALASWIQGGKDIAADDMGPIEGFLTKWGGKLLSKLTGGIAGFAGGGQYSGATIKSFAGGGQAGGMALVGEKGPELVDYFGPGGETIVNQPTLISRAAHVKPLGGPNMGFGSGYKGGGMTQLPTRQMSGYKGGGMTSLPARPMKAYASGGMFTDQAQLGDSKWKVSSLKRQNKFAAGLKAVGAGYKKRRESIAGAMAGGENPLQAGLAMEESGSEFARGFYAPRAILGETFRRSLAKKGIFPGSEMYISMQESKANTAIKQAGEDDYGNIDMGDTQFEAPTPRQERDLFKQIMQGDMFMGPQDVEAYMAISPRIKDAVDAQMKAGNIPPPLRVTAMGSGATGGWVTGHKLESDRVAEFKARGEAGTLPTKFYREGVGKGGRGDTQQEYDRLKREGYVYNKYGEWQLPAWGGYADMARGRSYNRGGKDEVDADPEYGRTEGLSTGHNLLSDYIDVDSKTGEVEISGQSWEKVKSSTYGKYQGKEGRKTMFGGQTTGYLGRNSIPTYEGGTPSMDYGQNMDMNPIAREKFNKFFGLDNIKWGEPIVYGTPDDKILGASEVIVNTARQEVANSMSVQNQRMRKQVTQKVELNAPAATNSQTIDYTTHANISDSVGLPDIPGSGGARVP